MATVARRNRYSGRAVTYGSMAYDLAYAPPRTADAPDRAAPRSKPLAKPQEEVRARPKVRVREQQRVSVFAILGFLAVVVFSITLLMGHIQLNLLADDVVSLQNEYVGLKKQEATLLAEYEKAFDLTNIEKVVTADGQMVKPKSDQMYYMDLSEPDNAVIFDEEESETQGLSVIGEAIKESFSMLMEYFQ